MPNEHISPQPDDIDVASEAARRVLDAGDTTEYIQPRRLSRSVRVAKALNRRHRQELAEAQQEGLLDELTGLNNRRGLKQAWRELMHSRMEGGSRATDKRLGAGLFVDIDHFGQINKRDGHDAGDKVLMSTASNIADHVRPDDIVARLGGGADEFVAILPGASLKAAVERAEALCQRNREMGVTLSIGVLPLSEDLDAFLKQGSQFMLTAKALGRDQVFDPTMLPDPGRQAG